MKLRKYKSWLMYTRKQIRTQKHDNQNKINKYKKKKTPNKIIQF